MASIPPLSSFRTTGRRGTRLRGERGGRNGPGNDGDLEQDVEAGRDSIVQQTDNDASSSRLSAVALGYLDDPYAKVFSGQAEQIPRRYPIINRGTYVRTTAIDMLVRRFLQAYPSSKKQIISLGAGSDTRFWRLWREASHNRASEVFYHEVDFETNVNRKRAIIRETAAIAEMTQEAEEGGWTSYLHAMDLRDLTAKAPPSIPGLDPDVPTLLLSECCLCYLPPDTTSSILHYFNMTIKAPMALILYEPIRPYDPFGRTMVSNLASRGIHMQTLKRYSSLEAQRQRLHLAGMSDGQGARDVHQLYQDEAWVSANERERVERLEWLDEVEEWKLLASHYCVAWGWKGEVFSEAWQDLDGSRTSAEAMDDIS